MYISFIDSLRIQDYTLLREPQISDLGYWLHRSQLIRLDLNILGYMTVNRSDILDLSY
uniref:Uncharacterized protein n=1 Tax=viral metagenome TaxID=1070528 RepID=A0A6C0BMK1_9ZZZZ